MSDSAFRTHDGRTLQRAASDLVQREVLCCMSSMVATLAGDAYNLPQSETEKLCGQAAELAAPVLDYEEAAREAGWKPAIGEPVGTMFRPATVEEADANLGQREVYAHSSKNACDQDHIEPHEREVYEHWAVSTWFAEKLQAADERVDTDFAGLCVWARTTTGQAIHADAVVERIAREMHEARA